MDVSNAMTETGRNIEIVRKEWGPRLLILGHHYQRASVLRHADALGDSLELARRAAGENECERIVFCGVHFMAESADILKPGNQTVFMPDVGAGCPMAAMADLTAMEKAWAHLEANGGGFLPVVYVNSTAEIKAMCGRLGGSTCTSSNAHRVMEWVFDQGHKVLFIPDEHLGTNTAHDMGLSDDQVAAYDPCQPVGGLSPEQIAQARVIVWKGFCIVHTAFTVEQIRQVRERHPDAQIIVHPETPKEVVRLCDAHGSTAQIIEYVRRQPAGRTIVIGTEFNLIERLADEHRGRVSILALTPSVCRNMAMTSERNLLDVLTTWGRDREVHVDPAVAADARTALRRMLQR